MFVHSVIELYGKRRRNRSKIERSTGLSGCDEDESSADEPSWGFIDMAIIPSTDLRC